MFPRKAVIRVDGNHERGMGHVYRMISFAHRLNQSGCEPSFVIKYDQSTRRLIEANNFRLVSLESESTEQQVAIAIENLSPNLIINDILDTEESYYHLLSKIYTGPIVSLDDCAAGLQHADLVINALSYSWNRYESAAVKTRLLEGPAYLILNPDLDRIPNHASTHDESICITIGGSDTRELTPLIWEAIQKVFPTTQTNVVLGPNNKLTESHFKPHPYLTVYRSPKSLIEIISRSKFILTSGGMTMFESLALGKSVAAIATEKHEIQNIKTIQNKTSLTYLGDWENVSLKSIESALKEQKSRDFCKQQDAQPIVDTKGAHRILKAIQGLYER